MEQGSAAEPQHSGWSVNSPGVPWGNICEPLLRAAVLLQSTLRLELVEGFDFSHH